MQLRLPPNLPVAFLVVWAIACVIAFLFSSALPVLYFAYFVLPYSACIVPLCVAHVSCRLFGLSPQSATNRKHSLGLSVASAVIGFVAYGMSLSVIGRFLEIPWRMGKFSDGTLSLGRSAAEEFGLAAAVVTLCAFALLRAAPPKSRYTQYAVGSMGMVGVASLMYLLFGLSPFVEWRA